MVGGRSLLTICPPRVLKYAATIDYDSYRTADPDWDKEIAGLVLNIKNFKLLTSKTRQRVCLYKRRHALRSPQSIDQEYQLTLHDPKGNKDQVHTRSPYQILTSTSD